MVSPAELVEAAVSAGLDLIAVTDHDTMASVREAQERGETIGLTVVAGEEITTRGPALTHVLGWFLEKPIRRGMTLADTVAAIHDQGGLAIVPHPFMPVYVASIQPGMLTRLLEGHRMDGIEMMATVPLGARRRRLLDGFYAANHERLGAPIGSSDSHFGRHDIGQVVTVYEGDFRTAVLEGTTRPERGRSRNVPTALAVRQQWRSLVELPVKRLTGRL
jgi:hypothetical protein